MRLGLFENILNECNEGNTMYKIKTKAAGRIVAAAALSFGLAASAVGVASASSQGHHSRHHEGAFTSYQLNRVEGTVSAYVAAAGTANGSISILSKHSTTPVVYVTTPATTITGLAASATLASPDKVVLVLSTTTPVTVTSIFVAGHGSKCDGSKFGNEKSNDRSFGRGGAQTRDFGGRNFGGRNSSKHGHFWK